MTTLPVEPLRRPTLANGSPLASENPLATERLVETDGELLRLFTRHNDTAAFDKLIERHTAMVWRVCRQTLRRQQDAEDAFQATFLLLVKSARQIGASESAAGWLFRVAYRTSLRARKRLASRREEALALDPAAPSEEQFPDLSGRQTIGVLAEELMELPLRYQTPLVMRYLEGQSRRDIAEATDVTVATVQGRLARGKQLLRRRLVRRGVSLAGAMGALTAKPRAEAAVAPANVVLQTTSNATALATGGSLAASTAVVLLLEQGTRAMLFASLTKPMAAAAACGLAALVLAAPPTEPTEARSEGLTLTVTIEGEEAEAPAATLQLTANEPASKGEPQASAPGAAAATNSAAVVRQEVYFVEDLQSALNQAYGDKDVQSNLYTLADMLVEATGVDPNSVRTFVKNKSLVIAADQPTHKRIADYLATVRSEEENVAKFLAQAIAKSVDGGGAPRSGSPRTAESTSPPTGASLTGAPPPPAGSPEDKQDFVADPVWTVLERVTEIERLVKRSWLLHKKAMDLFESNRAQVVNSLQQDNQQKPTWKELLSHSEPTRLEQMLYENAASEFEAAVGQASKIEKEIESLVAKPEQLQGNPLAVDMLGDLAIRAKQLPNKVDFVAEDAKRDFQAQWEHLYTVPAYIAIAKELTGTASFGMVEKSKQQVAEFQRKHGLEETGEFNEATWNQLFFVAKKNDEPSNEGEPQASAPGVAAANGIASETNPEDDALLKALVEDEAGPRLDREAALELIRQTKADQLSLSLGQAQSAARNFASLRDNTALQPRLSGMERDVNLFRTAAAGAWSDPDIKPSEGQRKPVDPQLLISALADNAKQMHERAEAAKAKGDTKAYQDAIEIARRADDDVRRREQALEEQGEPQASATGVEAANAPAPEEQPSSPTRADEPAEEAPPVDKLARDLDESLQRFADAVVASQRLMEIAKTVDESMRETLHQAAAKSLEKAMAHRSSASELLTNYTAVAALKDKASLNAAVAYSRHFTESKRSLEQVISHYNRRNDGQPATEEPAGKFESTPSPTAAAPPAAPPPPAELPRAPQLQARIAPLEELVAEYTRIYERIKALHDKGERGGDENRLAMAAHALARAKSRLAESRGDRDEATARLKEAVEIAEREVKAHQAAYDANRIVLSEVFEALERRADDKAALAEHSITPPRSASSVTVPRSESRVTTESTPPPAGASLTGAPPPPDEFQSAPASQFADEAAVAAVLMKEQLAAFDRTTQQLRNGPDRDKAAVQQMLSQLENMKGQMSQQLRFLQAGGEARFDTPPLAPPEFDAAPQPPRAAAPPVVIAREAAPAGLRALTLTARQPAKTAQPFTPLLPLEFSSQSGSYAAANKRYGYSVQQLQRRLNEVLNPAVALEADGDYGPKTVAAVRQYQTGHGLQPTGFADEETRVALGLVESPPRFAPPQPNPWNQPTGGGGAPSGSPRTGESTPPPTGASLTGAPPPPVDATRPSSRELGSVQWPAAPKPPKPTPAPPKPDERADALRTKIEKYLQEAEAALLKLIDVAKKAEELRGSAAETGNTRITGVTRRAIESVARSQFEEVRRRVTGVNSLHYGYAQDIVLEDPALPTPESPGLVASLKQLDTAMKRAVQIQRLAEAALLSVEDKEKAKEQFSFDIETFDPQVLRPGATPQEPEAPDGEPGASATGVEAASESASGELRAQTLTVRQPADEGASNSQYGPDSTMKQGQWRVFHEPSELDPAGWCVIAEVRDGEHLPVLLPGDERPRPHLKREGDRGDLKFRVVDPGHEDDGKLIPGGGWAGEVAEVRGVRISVSMLSFAPSRDVALVLIRGEQGRNAAGLAESLPNHRVARRLLHEAPQSKDSRTPPPEVTHPTATRAPGRVDYSDGKADGKKSLGGSGHLLRFDLPEGALGVKGVRIHGSRYGTPEAPKEDFEIAFLSEDRSEILAVEHAPYGLFRRGPETWTTVKFDKPVLDLPEKFWVAINFNPGRTKGVYLSYDTSTGGERSMTGTSQQQPDQHKPVDIGGDWMAAVVLERE